MATVDDVRMANKIELRLIHPIVPTELLTAIARIDEKLKYSSARHIFYCIPMLGENDFCGVFGDGGNAAYEWFIWKKGKLETSDQGWGIPEFALRAVLSVLYEREEL